MAGTVDCLDCHMPFAVSAGAGTMVNTYEKGEYRAHLFGISVEPAYALNDGSGIAARTADGAVRLTVDQTCAACHQSGTAPALSRAQLIENAQKVHD
jgi:mono/diheme cytochrome c family protein